MVSGSVNANPRHYHAAAKPLRSADPNWLARLITRRVPLASFAEALDVRAGDVKTVITVTG